MKQLSAWAYEATEYADRTYGPGWKRQVSFERPSDNDSGVRNIVPLYAATDLLEALVVLENAARDPIDAGLLNHARATARAAIANARS